MSSSVEVSIKIEIKPTDAPPADSDASALQIGPGHFQLVLGAEKSLDIDALEDGLLRSSFPALRSALATHLQEEVKKSPAGAS
jgi:hypothetical protein